MIRRATDGVAMLWVAAGGELAQAGIEELMATYTESNTTKGIELYRVVVFEDGEEHLYEEGKDVYGHSQ